MSAFEYLHEENNVQLSTLLVPQVVFRKFPLEKRAIMVRPRPPILTKSSLRYTFFLQKTVLEFLLLHLG